MDEATLKRMCAYYGLDAAHVRAPQKGYRNQSYPIRLENGETINLILYKREPGILSKIKDANRVSDYLAERGFPTRLTVKPQILKARGKDFTRYVAAYNYLPGFTIPWEAYTQDHIKLLGATMSRMHNSLRDLPDTAALPSVIAEYELVSKRMQRYFSDLGVQRALRAKLDLQLSPLLFSRFNDLLRGCRYLPDQQALHMDFVRGNILFAENEQGRENTFSVGKVRLTGILDFEKTSCGHPVFDIGRTLAFLLVDCKFKSEAQVRKYFLQSGYTKRGTASFNAIILKTRHASYDLLEELIKLFLLYDFYKFLRHNPYEYLPENEHFVRTRDLLLKGELIRPADAKMAYNVT